MMMTYHSNEHDATNLRVGSVCVITKKIDEDLGRGITFINGQGYYSENDLKLNYCVAESKESRLTVISAGSLIDQQITDAFSQLENTQVFMNAVTANFEGVTKLSIESKSLTTEYNTVQHAGGFSILVVFGIPAVILIGGFVVWFRRRKA